MSPSWRVKQRPSGLDLLLLVSLRNGKWCWTTAEHPMCAGWACLEASPCQLQPEERREAVTLVSEIHRRWPPRPGQSRHGESRTKVGSALWSFAFSRRRRKERGSQGLALLSGARLGEAAGLQHVTSPGPQSRDPESSQEGNPTCSGVQGGADGAVEL